MKMSWTFLILRHSMVNIYTLSRFSANHDPVLLLPIPLSILFGLEMSSTLVLNNLMRHLECMTSYFRICMIFILLQTLSRLSRSTICMKIILANKYHSTLPEHFTLLNSKQTKDLVLFSLFLYRIQ